MNQDNNGYRDQISHLGLVELRRLLGLVGYSQTGRKAELKSRVLELLRTAPVGLNYQVFLTKITETYMWMEKNQFYNVNINRNMAQQHKSNLKQTLKGINGKCNIAGNNTTQCNNQPTIPQSMPVSQQLSVGAPEYEVGYDMNTALISNKCIEFQSANNVTFKKLPFYEVVNNICKVRILSGVEECTLPYYSQGMRELVQKMPMSTQQVKYISLNPKLYSKNEYYYQAQIRIGLLEQGSTEVTDFLPFGLRIRISSIPCALPPITAYTSQKTEARRIPKPISCTHLLKLDKNIQNTVTFNWVPDEKPYVWGVFLVKKFSTDFLIQKILNKGAKSSDETKHSIIKKLAHYDPDLAITSYRISLMCPLGKMRMKMPTKSINCDHLQCFDAGTFILMNEKKPTWSCPTCNKVCNYEDLRIESYFLDIVTSSSLPNSCEEIEIMADGSWRVYVESEESKSDVANSNISIEINSKSSGNMKSSVVDLTLNDDDEKYLLEEKYTRKLGLSN